MKNGFTELPMIEWIRDDEEDIIALIVRREFSPSKTVFLTPDEYNQQIGFVVYSKGEEVDTHMHLPVNRKITGTSEVIILRHGRAVVRIYKEDKAFIAKRELKAGDLLLLVCGWHGIDFLEDSVIMEVKQGPYLGDDEKIKLKKGELCDSGK